MCAVVPCHRNGASPVPEEHRVVFPSLHRSSLCTWMASSCLHQDAVLIDIGHGIIVIVTAMAPSLFFVFVVAAVVIANVIIIAVVIDVFFFVLVVMIVIILLGRVSD